MASLYGRIRRDDMPSADEFWSAASEVVSERGHLVVGFGEGSEQPELGTSLDNVSWLQAPAATNDCGECGLGGLEGTS